MVTMRRLLRQPTFAMTAIGTLAVGIGATTAIFSTVNATLLRPLAYPGSQDIYTLNTTLLDGRWSSGRVTGAYIAAINESAPSVLRAVAVLNSEDVIITDVGENRQALVHLVTEGFFDLFGLPMAVGRAFTPEDHRSRVAVISDRIWDDVFGRDPAVVGGTIRMATGSVPIVGVAPPEFDVPQRTDVWVSFSVSPVAVAHNFEAYFRARTDTDPDRLRNELSTVMAGLAEEYPQAANGRAFVVRPLTDAIVGDLGPILLVVLAGAVVLLLLGSVNVATLVLGRSAAQTREVAVRVALGAGLWSVVRRFLMESFVLATAGTLAGLLLAYAGVRLLLAFGAAQLPRLDQVPFDGRVLLFAAGTLVTTAMLVGLLPAWRLATPDIRGLLNEAGRSITGARGTRRVLSGLVVAEVALAITLVSGAGWLVRSYANLFEADPGFVAEGRLVFTALLAGSRWMPLPLIVQGPDGPMLASNQPPSKSPQMWLESLTDHLQASAQIGAVGSAGTLPLRTDWDSAFYVAVPGAPYDPDRQDTARRRLVSPSFFQALGTRLIAGRDFSTAETAPVAVVNEAFVRRYLQDRGPVNETFAWGFPVVDFDQVLTVVGVVEDVKYRSLRDPADPIFYVPAHLARQTVVVETSLDDVTTLIPTVRAAVNAVDPSIPVTIELMEQVVSAELIRHRLGLILMSLFGLISLALAAVGIYGVIADATEQRAGELATRMAFGATPSTVRKLVMKQGWGLAIAGMTLGLGIAYAGGRLAASRLYEVRASDPVILVTAASAVLSITLLAFLVPALRASRREPVEGLRKD
jgi:predicted permease